jgi:hypothetical protein
MPLGYSFPNRQYINFFQFAHRVTFTTAGSIAIDHVPNIFQLRARDPVVRVLAWRVVAGMTNHFIRSAQRADVPVECPPVGLVLLSGSLKASITVAVKSAGPWVTSIGTSRAIDL